MKKNAQTLVQEHEVFRTKIKSLISQLYRENIKNKKGEIMPEIALTEEWEYEGQEFNTLTELGLAHRVNKNTEELFIWEDLETESLIEIVHILEEKEYVEC